MEVNGIGAAVTGGGNGIGRAIALALGRAGAKVAVGDLELNAAEAVAAELRERGGEAIAVSLDVTDEASVSDFADAAWAAFGSVQLLVNNAGVMSPVSPLADMTEDDYAWVFSVNVGGVLRGVRTFVPRFAQAGEPAHVLNTGSEHSLGVPHVGGGLYTASKHAVIGLSDVLRAELPAHIGVSVLCPGLVGSTLWKASERRPDVLGGPSEASEMAGEFMNHMGMSAEEVAEKAVAGVRRGDFLIPTHAHSVKFAAKRWREIESAFQAYAPHYDGDEKFDLTQIMAGQLHAQSQESSA